MVAAGVVGLFGLWNKIKGNPSDTTNEIKNREPLTKDRKKSR